MREFYRFFGNIFQSLNGQESHNRLGFMRRPIRVMTADYIHAYYLGRPRDEAKENGIQFKTEPKSFF